MIRGLYTSASGMLAAQAQSEIIGDNIANINTPGYKEEQGSNRTFPSLLIERINNGSSPAEKTPIGNMSTGVVVDRAARLNLQSPLETTNMATDLALVSEGNASVFFAVQTPDGVMYTRNGSFRLSGDGELQTMEGYAVLGENGPVDQLDADFTVKPDGTIVNSSGEEVNRLLLVEIPSGELARKGDSLYSATQVMTAEGVAVRQGALEGSTVDITTQITQMMTVMRAYEANQRVIQTQDGTLEKAVNEVGRV